MARKVKCKICGFITNTDNAFRVVVNGKNNYYCNEEEFNNIEKQKKAKKKCEETIVNMLKIPFLPPIYLKELKELNAFYEYVVIERAFKENEKQIIWFLNNNESSSDFGKARYIMAIIKNNIHTVNKRFKEEQKRMEDLFNNSSKKELDFDIMNDTPTTPIVSGGNDISEFL